MNKNKVSFEADVAQAGVPTPHGHVYTKEALESAVKIFNERVENRGGALHGELAFPRLDRVRDLQGRVENRDALYIDERSVSHVFNNARMEGDMMKVSAVILDTPKGTLVEEFMAKTAEGTQPVFGLRGAIPPGGIAPDGTITNFVPVTVDIVNVK